MLIDISKKGQKILEVTIILEVKKIETSNFLL